MPIKSEIIREGKHYRLSDLENKFDKTGDDLNNIIRILKEARILKEYTAEKLSLSDIDNYYYDPEDSTEKYNDKTYIFKFVGIISVAGIVLKCLPKYYLETNKYSTISTTENEVDEHIKIIFKVLEKYNESKESIKMVSDIDQDKAYNLLPLTLFLLTDYFEYGAYRNTQKIIEINGTGEILWDKTVNETFPLISNEKPYYFTLKTKSWTNDDEDYFRRLHCCILTCCSNDLENAGLLDLFGLPKVSLSEEELSDFGDPDYILYRIKKEFNVVFDNRKQLILAKMYDYITESTSLSDDDCCTFYGSNSFNLVWEDICAKIFNSMLKTELVKLPLPSQFFEKYPNCSKKMSELIDKPEWIKAGNEEGFKAETLKPDIITITNNKGSDTDTTQFTPYLDQEGTYNFLIFDAKYYTMTFDDENVHGQPGVGDVTKQYLYQIAFQNFCSKNGFKSIWNCFIMPTNDDMVINLGSVSMKMLNQILLGDIDIKPIKIRQIPVARAYKYYLNNESFPISDLHLEER